MEEKPEYQQPKPEAVRPKENDSPWLSSKRAGRPHYHGDIVRYLFLLSGLLLILNLPHAHKTMSAPLPMVIAGIAILVICAGYTNRLHKGGVVIDFIISAVGFFIAETSSVHAYDAIPFDNQIFSTYLAISILLLFAMYFSIRSMLRLFLVKP